jgi:hypothetical protein
LLLAESHPTLCPWILEGPQRLVTSHSDGHSFAYKSE